MTHKHTSDFYRNKLSKEEREKLNFQVKNGLLSEEVAEEMLVNPKEARAYLGRGV